jgi:hypothetical protein
MGTDSEMAAHAYYPRLAQLLNLSSEQSDRLRSRFPVTEAYWRGLNEYLESNEGRVGLPTAYALGHRYVGIPQSQALVRAGDRAKLPTFFDQFGLAPRSELIPADLERLLDVWIMTLPSPVSANLRRLWSSATARERIAGVVAVELSHWDGASREIRGDSARPRGELRVTALLRQQFGGRGLELSLAARYPSASETATLRVMSAEGTPSIGVLPAAGARLRPTPGSRLDASSLLGAVLDLENPVTGERVTRRPRRIVPLRRDELLGTMVEVDHVGLAEDAVVLVKDEPALVEAVLALISGHGHHGEVYGCATAGRSTLAGMPEGWLLIDDVQLFAVPKDVQRVDLHPLVPLTTAQVSFAGGLKLPGRIRKWSSCQPPELRVAVSEAEKLRVVLSEVGDERTTLEEWTAAAPAMVKPLRDLDLGDGDYEIEIFVNDESKPITVNTLRLRSSDTPDAVTWETCTRLNYELDLAPLGPLSAVASSGNSERLVDGLSAIGALGTEVATVPARTGASWETAKSTRGAEAPTVVLGQADPTSCMVTGMHRIELPTWYGGKVKGQIQGRCATCGVVKTYPARPRWRRPVGASTTTQPYRFDDLPSHSDLGVTWDTCVDALVHLGGGPVSALERIALQAEGSSLFVDNFLRTLEVVGHIDVRRDESLQPVEWEANPAFLAETAAGDFVLAGVWSPASRSELRQALAGSGGELVPEARTGGPTTWFVRGLTADELERRVLAANLDAYVIESAVERMLAALPSLGEVEHGLTSIAIPDYRKASIFDLVGASWRPSPGVGAPGAYRLEQSFRRVPVWVSPQDAVARRAKVGTSQLVKHLAARSAKMPLLGYLEGSQTLILPLGADLPGLYGRVAALCSGLPPQTAIARRAIGYGGVPRHVADRLNSLLVD